MARGKHGKKTKLNGARFARFLAMLAAAALLIIALIFGLKACSKDGAKDAAVNSQGGGEAITSPAGTDAQESAPTEASVEPKEPTPQEIAASMQDYSHAPGEKAAPISTVDENYLLLVNKTHPLSSDYWPEDLVEVSKTVAGVGNKDTKKMRRVAAEAMDRMIAAAAEEGIDIAVRTGFRSYDYQKTLFDSYAKNNGAEKANTFSAHAGESEHQTGLACDLGGKSQNYALSYSFGDTKEGKWCYEHCAEYGFILRFIDGTDKSPGPITGYVYEAWHFRYVGEEVAKEIMEKGITFEEYLGVVD